MVDNIPRVLAGRYEVGELIGRGGMAEVHIGYDSRLSRTVAIKLLRSDLAEDPTFHARFRREAQSAAALNHPAIVAVYDTGEETTTDAVGKRTTIPFIVMEYVEGHTVRELLKDGAAVPIDEALEIVVGVLGALEYSHNEGIVHRDIKPGNVMLTPTGQVKVMDFGIARAMSDQQATMTATNSVVGTAQYLSPEQARGEVVDHRSDLYSTGCVLFELLTGQPPFSGDSAVSVAYQHVREVPPVPSTIAGDIPDVLDRVVMKSLAKERDERYADANQMRADLLAVLHGGNVDAPAPTAWLPVGGLGAPTASTTPLRATTPETSRVRATATQTQARPLSDDSERGSRWWVWVLAILGIAAAAGIVWLLLNQDEPLADTATVPNVVGMDQATAAATLRDADLRFNFAGEEPSEEYEAGQAIRSDPAADAEVEAGSTVDVTFSTGPEEFDIPDVEGLTQERARQVLEDADLTISAVEQEDAAGIERDRALRTDPAAGSPAEPGDSVILYVATGRVVVENVVGMSEAAALDYLQNTLQLTVRSSTQPSNDQDAGNVVSMDPGPGTVDVGSTISIVISTGPTEPEPTQEPEPTTNPNQPTDVPTGPGENNGNP
ncbi:MAG: Stk1 family PASTA domain-containing Ser/Thr kinase [Actinobacteria bacterium]|nr:Stk1 family PASTA domain-containing Ser/Thr kinase [Actinomycetota bacterium]